MGLRVLALIYRLVREFSANLFRHCLLGERGSIKFETTGSPISSEAMLSPLLRVLPRYDNNSRALNGFSCRQTKGVAIDDPLSPIVCDINTHCFEQILLGDYNFKC